MSTWKYKFVNEHWVNIWHDALIQTDPKKEKLSFSTQKELVKSFRFFEKALIIHPQLIGWISWTKLEHTHMMIIFAKSGAQPYHIDVKRKCIWFKKFIKES